MLRVLRIMKVVKARIEPLTRTSLVRCPLRAGFAASILIIFNVFSRHGPVHAASNEADAPTVRQPIEVLIG
jgi:hypothetical protein